MVILLPYLNIFDSDGRPCRQQPALILPPTSFSMHRRIRVPEPYDLTLRIWIALLSPLYTIRDPSLIVLEREQAEVAAAGIPTPLTSHLQPSVKTLVARQRRVELYAANGSIIACDDPSTSTFRARYVIFSFLNASLTFL